MAAAAIGSALGTALYMVDYFFGHPNRLPRPEFWEIVFLPIISLVSLIGTIPGALIVGMPVTYPVRHIVAGHPVLSGIPFIGLSMTISFLLLGWAFKQPIGGQYSDLEILWFYSGGTTFGFVFMLAWWQRARTSGKSRLKPRK